MIKRQVNRLARFVATAAAVIVVGAFCTIGASAAPKPGGINFKAIGPAKATGKTLSLAKGKPGIFLIGPNGHSLYVYDKDRGTKSACTGGCETYWHAMTAKSAITIGAGIKRSEIRRVDGQKPDQVMYYGHLLYYFEGDSAPGQTTGTKIAGWHLLGPFGNVMLPKVS